MATLTLKNIAKRWGSSFGVSNCNLNIKDKEFIVFLGPSGCGKTTTMRMIAGLECPSEGEIILDDECINDLEPKDRDIAMVFQSYGLYPHLSVYENICFPLKVRRVDKSTHDAKVKKAAKMVELTELLDRKPKELSGGQRQRVALARAIVREPKIFLMDEPLSNLDAKLRVSTRSELKNLQRELSVTTIYVTHDQIEAMTMADRVVVMNKGKIQQIGTPKEIYNQPKNFFVATFIGSPPMNTVRGTIKNGAFVSDGVQIKNLTFQYEGEAYLGFRAEDVELFTQKPQIQNSHFLINEKVFNFELLGDCTLVNIKINDKPISAKADKHFEVKPKSDIYFSVALDKVYFFKTDEDGQRIS
mgnify:CR=1 FL=1